MKKNGKIVIYTDGGSRGNPGPAAIGVVVKDEKKRIIKNYAKSIGSKTNNEAEYEAVIFALQKIRQIFGKEKIKNLEIEIRMDSELVARQLRGEYKILEEKLFPLFIKIWNLKISFPFLDFREIPREQNKEADRLVNEILDKGRAQPLF
ncbi:MAG: Ribonuclease H [Parcubacteria group bacterium GW2011_GWB1_41_6]|nr:MAG: Ribonuclease H [Parcubacteria group bacterium GW2011_GWB1_41_6]KKS34668.1 MAG: Ribonuclease H [Parcubacteria group bacterium GW2011_GWC2_42_13]KKS58003.1 MAG: Ribonuclease H [Parcubacteria group bacterium GW2011_GWA2_42_35]KKS70392.1 MAG: Ribonuclease H [Parcubacteria group bacterium GW2011_GWF2_42_7]